MAIISQRSSCFPSWKFGLENYLRQSVIATCVISLPSLISLLATHYTYFDCSETILRAVHSKWHYYFPCFVFVTELQHSHVTVAIRQTHISTVSLQQHFDYKVVQKYDKISH